MEQVKIRRIINNKLILELLIAIAAVILAFLMVYFGFIFSLALVIGIVSLLIIIKKPFWGFLVYVALVYLRPVDLFPVLAQIKLQTLILFFLLILLFLNHFVFGRKGLEIKGLDIIILAFLMVMFISVFKSIWISESLNYFFEYFKLFVFYLLASYIIKTEKQLKWFILIVIFCMVFVCIIQIYTYLTIGLTRTTGIGGYGIHIGPINLSTGRSIGPVSESVYGVGGYSLSFLGNASELGLAILIYFPFAYYFYMVFNSKVFKRAIMVIMGIFCISLILTGSRGAAVGALFMVLAMFIKSKHKLRIATIGLLIGLIALPILPQKYVARIESISDYEVDESANIRIALWKAGLKMVRDHPLLGVGVGNFSTAYGSIYREVGSSNLWWKPHNNFIQVSSEMGLLGLIAYFSIMVFIFRENRKIRYKLNRYGIYNEFLFQCTQAVDISLVGYMIAGFFITSAYYPYLITLALISRAVSIFVENEVKGSRNAGYMVEAGEHKS